MDEHMREFAAAVQRIAELEQLVEQLGQQVDSLSEHIEYRFERHYQHVEERFQRTLELMEGLNEDSKVRDRDLEYSIDSVRRDAESWARDASSGRGW